MFQTRCQCVNGQQAKAVLLQLPVWCTDSYDTSNSCILRSKDGETLDSEEPGSSTAASSRAYCQALEHMLGFNQPAGACAVDTGACALAGILLNNCSLQNMAVVHERHARLLLVTGYQPGWSFS